MKRIRYLYIKKKYQNRRKIEIGVKRKKDKKMLN
jgi:hypothetical protein